MPWHASLQLDYRQQAGTTVLHHQHQGPLRIFKSLYPEGPAVCHNVIVHPPGGLVEGDRLDIRVRVEEDAHALISTPGATRFYKSGGTPATQSVQLDVQAGARLEWLPLETLAYNGCQGVNELSWTLAPEAELLAWDVVSLGLPAASQPFERGAFTQTLRWPGQWLEHARIAADDARLLHSPLGLDGQSSLGTLVLASGSPWSRAHREHLLEALRATLATDPLATRCGVTCPNDQLLVVRALADQVEPIMRLWQQLWAVLRQQAWHMPTTPPRVWQV